MEVFVIIALVVAVFGVVGWLSTHKAMGSLFWTTFGGIAVLSGYWGVQMVDAAGWDGLGYLILLVLGSAPAGLALLFGAGIGLLTCKKDSGTGFGAIPS